MKVKQVKESGRYGSNNPDTMSPGNYDRYQQDQMDYGKREFKRREMEHELGHEDEQERKEQSSTYYIRINGKLLKNKEGQPYQFRGKAAANKAAVTMMSKPFNQDKKFTLTTTASDRQDNPTPESSIAEMDGAPGQILAATGDKVTIDNKDGTQTIAPKTSLTRDPTGKGFVLSKTPTPGGEKPDEPKPGETVFKPATTEGTEKMNEAIRILRLAGLHKAADKLMEQQLFENPWEGKDPAKAQAWASMSPADQKWLGGADPTDPMILARAPNKGKAAAPATAPAAPAAPAVSNPQNPGGMSDEEMLARQNPGGMSDEEVLARQQTTGAAATSAATGVGIPGEEAAAQAAADKAMAPGAQDDVTGVDAAVAAQAAAPAAPTQAASPAAPAKGKSDPKVMAMQQELIKKGAKIKADGIMGPATQNAMRTYGSTPGATPLPAGVTPSTAGAGRGGQGGPTAAQLAAARPGANQPAPYNAAKDSQAANAAMAAKPAGGQAASPAAPVDPTKLSVSQRMATQPSVIDQGRAKLGIPAGGTGGAAPAPAAPSTQSAQSKAVSADYSSANDAGRNPNAGLEPGDPRWRGPKPASETIYREELNKMLTIARLR